MKQKTWKVLAIVFMSLFVAETLLFGWAIVTGNQSINNEYECSAICSNDDSYDAYQFDYYTDTCYCFTDEKIEYTKYMG